MSIARTLAVPYALLATLGSAELAAQRLLARSRATELDTMITRIFALDLAPGMAVAVVRDTAVIYLKGFGYADLEAKRPVTPETIFYIASSTKSFTALAAALLDRHGKLHLAAPLSRYLPTAKLQAPLSADSITLRDLLRHTHGISNEGPIVQRTAYTGEHTPALLLALLAEHPPEERGRQFRYGNIGYNVASLAMDAALKESWKDVVQRLVITPTRMTSTTAYMSRADRARLAMPYRVERAGFSRVPYAKTDGNMHAAGGLVSTAGDLAKWLEVNVNRGVLDDQRVFPAAVMEEVHRKHVSHSDTFRNYQRFGYGLGWQHALYGGDTLIHHFGGFSGFSAHVSFMPRHRVGVAVLVNDVSLGAVMTDLVAQYVYDKVRGVPGVDQALADTLRWFREQAARQRQRVGDDRARRAARPQTLPFPLEAYAGAYENRLYGRMEWRVVDAKLEARIGALRSTAEVYDGSKNAMRVELVPGQGEVVTFTMDNGRAKAIEYNRIVFQRAGG